MAEAHQRDEVQVRWVWILACIPCNRERGVVDPGFEAQPMKIWDFYPQLRV